VVWDLQKYLRNNQNFSLWPMKMTDEPSFSINESSSLVTVDLNLSSGSPLITCMRTRTPLSNLSLRMKNFWIRILFILKVNERDHRQCKFFKISHRGFSSEFQIGIMRRLELSNAWVGRSKAENATWSCDCWQFMFWKWPKWPFCANNWSSWTILTPFFESKFQTEIW